jgi:hypothetical protein
MTDRGGKLASIRRVDWRFLLPPAAFGTVAVVGRPDAAVLAGLEQVAASLVGPGEDGGPGQGPAPDLVVTIAATRSVLDEALRRVPAGGWIYVGAGPAAAPGRVSLRMVVAALRSAGFVDVRRSWHWPSEPAALEIVSLDDSRAVRSALDRRRSGRAARMKAALAGLALRLHLFERLVPGWSVIGRRPAGEDRGGDSTAPNPVLADVPDVGDAGVVLLTPRFLASRHVIGLVLGPAGGGLAAVVKRPRLPDDYGGIRREAEALQRAGALGVSGVPVVRTFRGAPEAVLVESAIDGVIIGSRELWAAPVAAITEIESWTRALAGRPGGRTVPLQSLWGPALERVAADARHHTSPMSVAIGELVERTRLVLGALGEVAVPLVIEHGDLAPPNLLRRRGGGLGVIDWEVADVDGLPLGDLLFFAAFVAGDPSGASAAARIPLPPAVTSVIEQQAEHLAIDVALIPALRLAMWTRWADRQLARFVDRTTPLEERLPARHVRSWAAAVEEMAATD